MRTTLGGALLLLTIAAAATGCGGSSDNTQPPVGTATPTGSSSTPTGSSSTPPDPRSQAEAAAQAMLRKYFTVTDHIGQDPGTPLSLLKTVATSTLLTAEQDTFKAWRAKGWKKTGGLNVTKMQVGTVSLDNSNPSKGQVPYVVIAVCTDASGVDVVDKDGKSVVLKSRPRFVTTKYTVANYHWTTDEADGWRVAVGEDEAVGKCAL